MSAAGPTGKWGRQVLAVMNSRSLREQSRVARLEEASEQAQHHHEQKLRALDEQQLQYQSGRQALSDRLRTQVRSSSDLNRYQRDLDTLNADVSKAQGAVRDARQAQDDAMTQLEAGRIALRQALLRETKWAYACKSLLQGVRHEDR